MCKCIGVTQSMKFKEGSDTGILDTLFLEEREFWRKWQWFVGAMNGAE